MSLRRVNHVHSFFVQRLHPVCVYDQGKENDSQPDQKDEDSIELWYFNDLLVCDHCLYGNLFLF